MKYRRLGKTDIEVSTVCLGCWALIGGFNWGAQDEKDSIAAIEASLDNGINFLDTAPGYGDGASEELLGRILKGRRDRLVVATKVSRENLGRDKLKESCETSLRRLQTDYVDLLQVHWPNHDVPMGETLKAMQDLVKEGKVREIGVSNFGLHDMTEVVRLATVQSNQLAYSLLWRAVEYEIRDLCARENVGILCYSPLAQGLLTGKFKSADEVPDDRRRTRLFSSERPFARHGEPGCEAGVFSALEDIKAICEEIGRPMGNVALAWLLAQPAVTSVVTGARSAGQARQNLAAADLELSAECVRKLSTCTDEIRKHIGADADMWESGDRSRMR